MHHAAIAALEPPYASALEVGCSSGVLSQRLAERCERLLAVDVGEAPLEQARLRVPGARFERREVPGQWPDGAFDLIVCCEVLSSLDAPALADAIAAIERTLVPGGSLLWVHSRHPAEHRPPPGEGVHEALTALGWPKAVGVTTPDYLLERFDRP